MAELTALWQDWRVAVALCAISWGLWGVLGKLAAMRLGWPTAVTLEVMGSLLVIVPLMATSFRWPGAGGALLGLAYGVAGAGGMIFFTKALASGPATLVAPMAEGYMVITVLLAVLLLGESLSLRQTAGVALVVTGAALLAAR